MSIESQRLLIICRGGRYRLITRKDQNGHRRVHIVKSTSGLYRLVPLTILFVC